MITPTSVGYSVTRGGSGEGSGALVPLLERLVQLVEKRGTEGLMDRGGDSEGNWTKLYLFAERLGNLICPFTFMSILYELYIPLYITA